MGFPNLSLRGSIYWWRRKVTVSGVPIAFALSLNTGSFNVARIKSACLSAELETLRMAYGERGTAIDPGTLKKIFFDALRWQLQRIQIDQTASSADPAEHAMVNRTYAEMWRIFARPDQRWTAEDDERLAAEGWDAEARSRVATLWEERRHGPLISRDQIEHYRQAFGFQPTTSNLTRIERTILAARAHACDEATAALGQRPNDFGTWAKEALSDQTPFAFEHVASPAEATDQPSPRYSDAPNGEIAPTSSASTRYKKLLTEAAQECIDEHVKAGAWGSNSVTQVETAIKLFDYACGGNVYIEDLRQKHVKDFYDLCAKMPSRWGKTKDEIEHGISASVQYGEQLAKIGKSNRLGFGHTTLRKHRTWIDTVLRFAADDGGGEGHRPPVKLDLAPARAQIGSKAEEKKKRARDKRANWNRAEIVRLLEAPIWSGCKDLDSRFDVGPHVYHDAWYWLPLMYILYGGRSSELAGLNLKEVHEDGDIPYFEVAYNDLRGLKNAQSVRKLPIHPELTRLGFVQYVTEMRKAGHKHLFPEMISPNSKSVASTVYKSIFRSWRKWAFPHGTQWRHEVRGQVKDKDVHSFRGVAVTLMKGKVEDSVRIDIIGHEGEGTTDRVYDEEAELGDKLKALELLSRLTKDIQAQPLRLRPPDRQKFGARRGRPPNA